jgi:hypothetical protein
MLAADIAADIAADLDADLDAWGRLLTLRDTDRLADAEPDTMRFRRYHLPACLPSFLPAFLPACLSASPTTPAAAGSNRATGPWAEAFTACRQRLTALPAVT